MGQRGCAQHTREVDLRRGTASARGYGANWRTLRAVIIARDPTCTIRVVCMGDPSTDADHIVARSAGGTDDPRNLRGACHRCHSHKTVTEDGGFGRPNHRRGLTR